MPEGIDLPRDFGVGSGAELRKDASVPELQVEDHVRVGRRRLVRHDPATACELELAGGDEAANDGLRRGIEAPPPALEEALLHVCKGGLARPCDSSIMVRRGLVQRGFTPTREAMAPRECTNTEADDTPRHSLRLRAPATRRGLLLRVPTGS